MVLIRSVLNFIPVHQMLVNVLHAGVKKLHDLFSHFLWDGTTVNRQLHFGSWRYK